MATDGNLNAIFNISSCISGLRALSTAILMVTVLFVASLHAQDVSPHATYNFKSSEQDSIHTSSIHSYQSEAQRANDALLITEVKKALADDGVTAYRPVVVDCDHGTILLNGIVGSSADAQHAATIARDVDGVIAVKNNLKWP
jgi:osmotically-inducible protein OsmY